MPPVKPHDSKKSNLNFEKMMRDVEISNVPLQFVSHVHCNLRDGTSVTIDRDEFGKNTSVESVIKNAGFSSDVTMVAVSVNSSEIETYVEQYINELIEKCGASRD